MTKFNYYIQGFKNIFNYKDSAQRFELNWFICFYFLLVILILTLTLLISFSFGAHAGIPLLIGMCVIFILGLIHTLPFLSLIKRRLNCVMPNSSGMYFSMFMTAAVINFVLPFASVLLHLSQSAFGVVNIITNFCLGFMLLEVFYLMIKK